MQTNQNFEKTVRKERNERPPRGNAQPEQPKRTKEWQRSDKRNAWDAFGNTFGIGM